MESMENEILSKHLDEKIFEIKKQKEMKQIENKKKIENNLLKIEELNKEKSSLIRSKTFQMEYDMKMKIISSKIEELENEKRFLIDIEELQIEMNRKIEDKFDDNTNKLNNLNEIKELQETITQRERNFKETIPYNKLIIEKFSEQQRKNHIPRDSFSKYGYKMCLSLYIDDDYVEVYFHLMRDDYDNYLEWPFKYDVTIDIINQMDDTVYESKTIKCDDLMYIKFCEKPKTDRNDGICVHRLKNDKNFQSEIIRDNRMIIKYKINI